MFSEPSSQNPHPYYKRGYLQCPLLKSNKAQNFPNWQWQETHLSVMHPSFMYLCISIYHLPVCILFTIPLSSVSLPLGYVSIAHLFPVARLYIDRSSASLPPGYTSIPHAICVFPVARLYVDSSRYLHVCLTITPCSSHRLLSGFAVLTSFSVSVSLAGLSRSLCAPGSSPQIPRLLERQLGRLLLARGP